ncbi:Cell cycle-regulated histone H1-binding protein [Trachipleistophora hominis]|uniref:Cell cycle-regulated histone H1-binding protein n=1 Tax=Trachipleistophora hominis TaxID=72359 RepID=L7JWU7_TRAHO|nr:Cell cycle-regulated histone H1-binding protein [Trachipleistophora hominis]
MHKRIDENDQQAHTIGYRAYIYIEYAHCLIRNVNNYFQTLLLQLNAHQPSMLQKKEIYEEDLEIAWNVLEQARLFFKMKNDKHQLKKVYFLQGEIYLLNDQHADAVREFSECLLVEDEQFVCDGTVYKRIGDCYFFLGDRMMATTFYEKGVVYYNGVGNARKSREMELLLMSARDREEMGFREEEHKIGEDGHKIGEGENERVVVDVNHLIRKKSVEKGK